MAKKYIVDLTTDEQNMLAGLIASGTQRVRKTNHARILLKADAGWTDQQICEALDVSAPTVERVRRQFVEEGLQQALSPRRTRRKYRHLVDGIQEAHLQLISEKRQSIPMKKGHPECYDYEYHREGTANLFLFFAPLLNWRHIKVTEQRTKMDWAVCIDELVHQHFPNAVLCVLVEDQLNTHTPSALYEALKPAKARSILDRSKRLPGKPSEMRIRLQSIGASQLLMPVSN